MHDIIVIVPIHGKNFVGYFLTRYEAERWAEKVIEREQKHYPHAHFEYVLAHRLRGSR